MIIIEFYARWRKLLIDFATYCKHVITLAFGQLFKQDPRFFLPPIRARVILNGGRKIISDAKRFAEMRGKGQFETSNTYFRFYLHL
jgi:hypothetical protein